ncbi:imidazole glycerol phosphate synthase cyclase subunit [Pelagibacteraceae bacterium]|nr:imidazole glycerol phosphate synthase cyclase subunit [Pelagibacteraceae bacterium]
MIKIRVIPTILYNDYSIVKGKNFDSWRVVGNLIQSIKIYSLREVDELIILDISASKEKKGIDIDMVKQFTKYCFMPLTLGGGISSTKDITNLLSAGADKVSINSAALTNPGLISESVKKFGSQCITISLDYKKKNKNYELYTHSATKPSGIDLFDYLKELKKLKPGEIILTSIEREGSMNGYDLDTLSKAIKTIDFPIIASGGCGNYEHMIDVLRISSNFSLAAASIFHFTEQTPLQAKIYLKKNGFRVRK